MRIKAIKKPTFLTSNAKKPFNSLKQVFIKALIFKYFNLENHTKIKTNILGYAISKIFSQ